MSEYLGGTVSMYTVSGGVLPSIQGVAELVYNAPNWKCPHCGKMRDAKKLECPGCGYVREDA